MLVDAPVLVGAPDSAMSCPCQAPTTVAGGQASPSNVVVDTTAGGFVYWLSSGRVMRCDPACAGGPASVPMGASPLATSLAVGDGYIAWTTAHGPWALVVNGTTPNPMPGNTLAYDMTIDPQASATPACFFNAQNSSLNCCELAANDAGACTLSCYYLGSPAGLVSSLSQKFFFGGAPDAGSARAILTATATACANNGKGAVVTLVSPNATGLAVNTTTLYWTEPGVVKATPRADGGGAWLLYEGGQPGAIAADSAGVVYFADEAAGTILRIEPDGGATTLAQGEGAPSSLAYDATYVYWTNQNAGTVRKIPKCACAP